MDTIFNKISVSLIILGVGFYAFAMTFTALIPSIYLRFINAGFFIFWENFSKVP